MTIRSIETATRHIMENTEVKRACEELREAHQEMQLCERLLGEANDAMTDSRTRLLAAISRMETMIQGLKHDAR